MAKAKKIAEPVAEVSEEVVAVEVQEQIQEEVQEPIVDVVEPITEPVAEVVEVIEAPKVHVVTSKVADAPIVEPEFLPKDTVEFYNKRGELCYAPYAYIAKRGYTALRKYTKK